MRSEGRIFQRGAVFWIAYYVRGKEFREAGGKTEKEAAKKLKARLGEKLGDRFIGPEQERVTVGDLLDSFLLYLEMKGAKSLYSVNSNVATVRSFFGDLRAVDVTTKRIEAFIELELVTKTGKKKTKAAATVNRDMAALRGAFNLARKQGRISRVPYFPMLREDNARQGFFEKDEFETVEAALPRVLADVARFAYLSGWRKGEILPLTWENVDRAAAEVRIATSKNGHGRMLPLTGALKGLIERRWQAREYLTPEKVTAISPRVFHNSGAPVGDFRKAWASACRAAKVPGRLFHDPPHGGPEHDPRWSSSDRGHEHQRTPHDRHVQPLQHRLARRSARGPTPHRGPPRGNSLGAEHRRNRRTRTEHGQIGFRGGKRLNRDAFEVLLWCRLRVVRPSGFEPEAFRSGV